MWWLPGEYVKKRLSNQLCLSLCVCVCVFRLQEEVELLEDEMRRREEGITDVETDGEMEGAL